MVDSADGSGYTGAFMSTQTDAEFLHERGIDPCEMPEPMITVERAVWYLALEHSLALLRRAQDAEDRLEHAECWRPAALLFAFAFVVAFVLVVTR
jgi:hypothetical protein